MVSHVSLTCGLLVLTSVMSACIEHNFEPNLAGERDMLWHGRLAASDNHVIKHVAPAH